MADAKNILVGAAEIFISRGNGVYRPSTQPGVAANSKGIPATAKGDVNFPNGTSAKTYLNGANGSPFWRNVGYTNNGFEISYEPTYNDVMVDQLLDAARLFKSQLKVMLTTELTEGTLENINLVFGQSEYQVTYDGTGTATSSAVLQGTTGNPAAATTSSAQLNIAAGALGDAPVERSLVAVGNAPARLGSYAGSYYGSGSAIGNVGVDAQGVALKERVYIARRVVQVQSSAHGLKRDTATVFPVQFRCLPDDADAYDGAEYGLIIDRVVTV